MSQYDFNKGAFVGNDGIRMLCEMLEINKTLEFLTFCTYIYIYIFIY